MPHQGAFPDRLAGYREWPLPLLQRDSEFEEFHKGIGTVVFPVGFPFVCGSDTVFDDGECGGRQLWRHSR